MNDRTEELQQNGPLTRMIDAAGHLDLATAVDSAAKTVYAPFAAAGSALGRIGGDISTGHLGKAFGETSSALAGTEAGVADMAKGIGDLASGAAAKAVGAFGTLSPTAAKASATMELEKMKADDAYESALAEFGQHEYNPESFQANRATGQLAAVVGTLGAGAAAEGASAADATSLAGKAMAATKKGEDFVKGLATSTERAGENIPVVGSTIKALRGAKNLLSKSAEDSDAADAADMSEGSKAASNLVDAAKTLVANGGRAAGYGALVGSAAGELASNPGDVGAGSRGAGMGFAYGLGTDVATGLSPTSIKQAALGQNSLDRNTASVLGGARVRAITILKHADEDLTEDQINQIAQTTARPV